MNTIAAMGSTSQAFPSQQEAGINRGTEGLDDFLKLFLIKLQYQDPLNPIEDQDFVAQLATFSQLEEARAASSALGAILDHLKARELGTELNLLGHYLSIETEEGQHTGLVEGIRREGNKRFLTVAGQELDMAGIKRVELPAQVGEYLGPEDL